MRAGNRLEQMGQVGFIVMSLAVTVAAVRYVVTPQPAAAKPVRPPAVAIGTKLPLPAYVTDEGRAPALLAVLSSECRFCTDSMPFYRKLASLPAVVAGRVKFHVVSVQPVDVMRGYLEQHRLAPASILTGEQSGAFVRGTPALILTDRAGVVTDSWSGALPPEEERTVLATLTRLQQGEAR